MDQFGSTAERAKEVEEDRGKGGVGCVCKRLEMGEVEVWANLFFLLHSFFYVFFFLFLLGFNLVLFICSSFSFLSQTELY